MEKNLERTEDYKMDFLYNILKNLFNGCDHISSFIVWLIENTNNLSRPIHVTLEKKFRVYINSNLKQKDVKNINSLLNLVNPNWSFEILLGKYKENGNYNEKATGFSTIWISPTRLRNESLKIKISQKEIAERSLISIKKETINLYSFIDQMPKIYFGDPFKNINDIEKISERHKAFVQKMLYVAGRRGLTDIHIPLTEKKWNELKEELKNIPKNV